MVESIIKKEVVVKIAGDSGDGIQLIGGQFTGSTYEVGNDLATFPDFPAEIRAPQGTQAGVSGFQIHFGSVEIETAGDECDVLVALNAAALKINLKSLKPGGILIVDTNGFDSKNLKLAGYGTENPLDSIDRANYQFYGIAISDQTKRSVEQCAIDPKEKDRCKNMYILGVLYWLYERNMDSTIAFLNAKFGKQAGILEANVLALKAGYYFGETTEIFKARYEVKEAHLAKGDYRNITGNQAISLGLIAASHQLQKPLFFATYPITPASDILHELAKYKEIGVETVQAEDEIAAATMAIGAVFGGNLGVTCTSGPCMDLKAEAISLAVSMEIPLVVIDVQRAGPSTGMPTKTEQADLLMAMYGRHGECPLPIIAAKSPSNCFEATLKACEIAFNFNTPVILLSDGYIANGSEPWLIPNIDEIDMRDTESKRANLKTFERDENMVRPFIPFGIAGKEYRIGGLEKDFVTGGISYDAQNHEKMILTREAKVNAVTNFSNPLNIELGSENDEIAVIGWGSTYGSIRAAVKKLREEGHSVAHIHFTQLHPFPANTEKILKSFKKIIVPEMNRGQLVKLIREQFLIDAISYSKVQGVPFKQQEIVDFILKIK